MINLLPNDDKTTLHYARANTRLLRWLSGLLLALLGTALIVAGGLFYLKRSTSDYNTQLSRTQDQLKSQKLEETQKQVQDISSSLKLVTQVLSREVLFSKLLKQIGSAIPAKASLTDLKIGKIEGGIDLTAIASDYTTATQVQVNLQDPANKIFDKADIVSINCSNSSNADPKYPCTVTIRTLFAKNNPYLFINTQKVTKP